MGNFKIDKSRIIFDIEVYYFNRQVKTKKKENLYKYPYISLKIIVDERYKFE